MKILDTWQNQHQAETVSEKTKARETTNKGQTALTGLWTNTCFPGFSIAGRAPQQKVA